jgi:hypothetical protein
MGVDRLGNHSKRITEILAQQFRSREKLAIKHRVRYLMEVRTNLKNLEQPVTNPEEEEGEEQEIIPEESGFDPEGFFKTDKGPPVFASRPNHQ